MDNTWKMYLSEWGNMANCGDRNFSILGNLRKKYIKLRGIFWKETNDPRFEKYYTSDGGYRHS